MTSYSPLLRIAELVPLDPATENTWGNILTASVPLYEQGTTGWTPVSINGLTSYTLTTANNAPDQARYFMQVYTGALTGDCTVTVPNVQRLSKAQNATSGGHNVIISAGAGVKATIPPTGFAIYDVETDGAGNASIIPFGAGSVISANATITNATITNAVITGATITNLALGGASFPYIRIGTGTTNGAGLATITFSPAFPIACDGVVATVLGANIFIGCIAKNTANATIFTSNATGSGLSIGFSWIAFGR